MKLSFNSISQYIYTNRKVILTFLLVLLTGEIFARAGGGGSHSSGGSGGGDGLGQIIYIIFRLIPFPFNIGVIVIGGTTYYFVNKKIQQNSVFNSIPDSVMIKGESEIEGIHSFKQNNTSFEMDGFLEKVKKAFLDIQTAWAVGDISPVRRLISDGVYQRFTIQQKMMGILKQTNTLEEIEVYNVGIDRFETDGGYDIAHVAMHAQIKDHFVSEELPSENSGGREEFVEYWSFIRKTGIETKDMYSTTACPNCGSPLPDNLGELSKCEYCKTVVNTGEFDWILAEITQADDYMQSRSTSYKKMNLEEDVAELFADDKDFSVQMLEDKASNGYLQILTALSLQDEKMVKRFVSKDLFASLRDKMSGDPIVYNRIFLNDVVVVGFDDSKPDLNEIAIFIRSSYQKVQKQNGKFNLLDSAVASQAEVVIMQRAKSASESKGSLYAHTCPSCGAPVADSLDENCSYCNVELNSPSHEWIINEILTPHGYQSRDMQNTSDVTKMDKLYDVREYALNNVLIMIAIDGQITEEELEFANKIANKWGYSPKKLSGLMQMAQTNRLSIKMPADIKKSKKILKMMEKAAQADDHISPEEQNLLDQIKQGIEGSDAA